MIESESIQNSLQDSIEQLKYEIAKLFGKVLSQSLSLGEKRQNFTKIVALVERETLIVKPAPFQCLLLCLQKLLFDKSICKLKNECFLLLEAMVGKTINNGKAEEKLFCWSWDLLATGKLSKNNDILVHLLKIVIIEDNQSRLLRQSIPNFATSLLAYSATAISKEVLEIWDAILSQYPSTLELYLPKLALYCLESDVSEWLWKQELVSSWKANNMSAASEVLDIAFVKLRLYAADASRLAPFVNALEKLSLLCNAKSTNILGAIAALKQTSSAVILEQIVLLCNRLWSPSNRLVIDRILQTHLTLLVHSSDATELQAATKALLSINQNSLNEASAWLKTFDSPLMIMRRKLIIYKQTAEIDALIDCLDLDDVVLNEMSMIFGRIVPSSNALTVATTSFTDKFSESELLAVLKHDLKAAPTSFISMTLNCLELAMRHIEIWWCCFELLKDVKICEEIVDFVIEHESDSAKLIKLVNHTTTPEKLFHRVKDIKRLSEDEILHILNYLSNTFTVSYLKDDLKFLLYHQNELIRKKALKLLLKYGLLDRSRPQTAFSLKYFIPEMRFTVLETFEYARNLVSNYLCSENGKASETLQMISDQLQQDNGSLAYLITLMVRRIKELTNYEPIIEDDFELRTFYRKHSSSISDWYEGIRKTLFVKLIHARCFGMAYYHIYNRLRENYADCNDEMIALMKWASMTRQFDILSGLKQIIKDIVDSEYEDDEHLIDLVSGGIDPLGEHPAILRKIQDVSEPLKRLQVEDLTTEFQRAMNMLLLPHDQFDPTSISADVWTCLWPQLQNLSEHFSQVSPLILEKYPEFAPNDETREFYQCLCDSFSSVWEERWFKCVSKIIVGIEEAFSSLPDLLSEAKELFAETLAQRSRPKSPHESYFAAEYGISIHKLLQAKDTKLLLKDFKKVAASLGKMIKERSLKVSKLCPRLKDLARSGKVILPGTFSFDNGKISYSGPKQILGIDETVIRLSSKSMPKKMRFLLKDQKTAEFMIKTGSEIAVEDRINQIAWMINDPNIKPLQMLCIQKDAWLIEWIPDAASCFQVVEKYNPINGNLDFSADAYKADREKGLLIGLSEFEIFQRFQAKVPEEILLNYCLGKETGPLLEVQESLARCLGALSAFGFILGIGDRHLDNILIDSSGQKIYQIDLGLCFDEGSRLSIPETVPFRLTKAFQGLIGHSNAHFKESFCRVLSQWRQLSPLLKGLLEFWVRHPVGRFRGRQVVCEEECDEVVLMPRSRSLVLSGLVDQVIERGESCHLIFEGSKYPNDNDLVDALMQAASDEKRLCRMYGGWMSWI